MEKITKQKLEEILSQFTADFLGFEENKNSVIVALIAKRAEQSHLDAFRAAGEKLGTYIQLISSALNSMSAEVTSQLQLVNAGEYASKLGFKITENQTFEPPKKKK